MGPFGVRIPRFDAVFNKTASLYRSLYARARVGIAEMDPKYPKSTPTDTPKRPRETCHVDWDSISPADVPSYIHNIGHEQLCIRVHICQYPVRSIYSYILRMHRCVNPTRFAPEDPRIHGHLYPSTNTFRPSDVPNQHISSHFKDP